jgi:23S rRNA (guanine745-N1)-methyltransferase
MLSVLARRCRLPIRRQARCIETHREPPLPRCRKEERASTPKRLNRRGVQSSTAVVVAASTSSSPSSSSSSLSPWLCPACSSPLSPSEDGKSLSCPQNHCYDLARERYVNLLRSGRKAKKTGAAPAGDAPEALAARGRFFAAGHFDAVMDAAADAVLKVLERRSGDEKRTVLDAGCGEGAYLRRLSHRLASSSNSSSSSNPSSPSPATTHLLLGVDVAKAAVRSAASRWAQQQQEERQQLKSSSSKSEAHFAVASAFDLPLSESSVSCALVAFAPLPSAELRRVLVDDDGDKAGAVVVVGPGPEHFLGLKKEVYGPERARPRGELDEEEEGEGKSSLPLKFSSQARVQYRLSLDGPAAFDLLQMTPYWWKASDETKARIREQGLETEVDVLVGVVERGELDLM